MKKTVKVDQYDLPLTVSRDNNGYMAICPLWEDCYAQGDTIDEAITEAMGVASSLIELYKEERTKIPLKVKAGKVGDNLRFSFPIVVSA